MEKLNESQKQTRAKLSVRENRKENIWSFLAAVGICVLGLAFFIVL